MTYDLSSPWKFAESWYREGEFKDFINRLPLAEKKELLTDLDKLDAFIVEQSRLAMTKGIDLAQRNKE